jgi:conjugal transfer/entry exclusion protein
MKSKSAKVIATLAVLTLVFASPARAILGIADVVFDPTNYAQAIKSFIQLQQQYAQLIQIYQQSRQQYQQLVWMAQTVPVNMQTRYRAAVTPWTNSTATNTYGTTVGWTAAINTGVGVDAGYSQSVQKLDDYGSAFGSIPSGQVDRIKTSYATVELTDGANLQAIETIGRIRANSPALENTLQALEQDSLSSDPAMNTEVAVLNKINAANLIGIRNTQDTNKLLVSLAEQQIVAAKRTRDSEAQAIDQHARFMTEGRAALTSQADGASAAMLAWRMP